MRLIIAFFLVALASPAQRVNSLTTEEQRAGWQLLFDGESMEGWAEAPADAWTLEDGCLKSLPHALIREDLISLRSFGDFEMSFEWKVAPGSNSGVKYKIQDTVLVDPRQIPGSLKMSFERQVAYALEHQDAVRAKVKVGSDAQVYPIALEYQVIDNDRHRDALTHPDSRAAALYRMAVPVDAVVKPVGEFNQGRIVVKGMHVEHWLNGVKVVDTMLDTPDVRKRIEERWPQGNPVRGLLEKLPTRVCPVGLQNHGDAAWFRNIKVRELR